MVAADLGGDSDDDDADPFTNMRADLAALRGGLTVPRRTKTRSASAPTRRRSLTTKVSDSVSRLPTHLNRSAVKRSSTRSACLAFRRPSSTNDLARRRFVKRRGRFVKPRSRRSGQSSRNKSAKAIGQPDLAFAFPKQADVGVLSRAIGSLVTAGVPIEQAREIVGL